MEHQRFSNPIMDPKQNVHDCPMMHTVKKNDNTAGYPSLFLGARMKETTTKAVPMKENHPTMLLVKKGGLKNDKSMKKGKGKT